jgi:hypothetical protein
MRAGPKADAFRPTLGEVLELLDSARAYLGADGFQTSLEPTGIRPLWAVQSRQMGERIRSERAETHFRAGESAPRSDIHASRLAIAARVRHSSGDVVARFDARPSEDGFTPVVVLVPGWPILAFAGGERGHACRSEG